MKKKIKIPLKVKPIHKVSKGPQPHKRGGVHADKRDKRVEQKERRYEDNANGDT